MCECTWCIAGTKTEQSRGQPTCSGREREEESDQRLCSDTWDTGLYLDIRRRQNYWSVDINFHYHHSSQGGQKVTMDKPRSIQNEINSLKGISDFDSQNQTFGYYLGTVRNVGLMWNEQAEQQRMRGTFYCVSIGKQTGRGVRHRHCSKSSGSSEYPPAQTLLTPLSQYNTFWTERIKVEKELLLSCYSGVFNFSLLLYLCAVDTEKCVTVSQPV